MNYPKEPISYEGHIDILISRGLIITDRNRALKYLKNVGYFRLTGYMYHLQSRDGSHKFKDGVSFNDVILHYQFDKKLRELLLSYIERIEGAIKARLTDRFSSINGFYWYTNYDLFQDKRVFDMINEAIKEYFDDPQERYLKSFKKKYIYETLPPSNMAMEILSLGKISKLYSGLVNNEQKKSISEDFGLPSTVLSTWFIRITMIRNICAHHSRLWNRAMTASKPVIPTRKGYQFTGETPDNFNTSVYGSISIIERLLHNINSNNTFIEKLELLFDSYPSIEKSFMGFPEDWKENPAWKR